MTTFTFKGKVTPKKAGTPKKPQGVKLTGDLAFTTVTQGVEPPIITGSTILLPKSGKWNGGKYKTCSLAILNRKGPSGCDKKAIVGKARGVALADTVDAKPTITFVNGGASKLYAYTVLYNPALVKEPVILKIKKLSSGPWGYRVTFKVPETLQVVAGVPITLRSLHFELGKTKAAPNLITTTACKGGKHAFNVETNYLYSNLETAKFNIDSSVACTK